MPDKFNQSNYVAEYNRTHYDPMTIRLTQGSKDRIKKQAKARGMSMAMYILWLAEQDEKSGA